MAASRTYASALGDLRDTVKWIMVAFTGAGTIIFSGLTITNISSLAQDGQWLVPVIFAAVPLAAAVCSTIEALRVINMTPPSVGLLFPQYWALLGGEAVPPIRHFEELKTELPQAIGVYGTADAFDRRLVDAFNQAARARELLDGTIGRQNGYEKALALLDGLQETVKDALDCVTYTGARRQFRTFIWRLLFATLVALAGLVASGVVTGTTLRNQQAADLSSPLSFRSPTPVQVWLTSRPPSTAGGPHACTLWNGMPALAVGGTVNRPVLLFPGYSISIAHGHGIRSASAQCADPWLWSPTSGEVLVEPR